jgi:hypothetical protein
MNSSRIDGYLERDERVLWKGRPAAGVILTAFDLFRVPFSIVWCAFAVFWTFMASQGGAPIFFTLWGCMFVAFGLFFVFGRLLVDAWLRGNTAYALTDQRILISRAGPFASFTSLDLRRLPPIKLSEGANSRGTIRFGEAATMFGGNGFHIWLPALDPTPQFQAVENARSVFQQIQKASAAL